MTDIVERLRAYHSTSGDCREAADEIEHLRAALDKIIGICLGREDGLSAAKVHSIAHEALADAGGKP